jgi:hypothetical protein
MYNIRFQKYVELLYYYTHYIDWIQHNELSILKLFGIVIFKNLLYLLSNTTIVHNELCIFQSFGI